MSAVEPRVLRWEAPPDRMRATGRVDWGPVARELRGRPGEWAVLGEHQGKLAAEERRLKGMSSNIRTGNIRAFAPKGDFEASTRMIGDRVVLFARFVGEGAPQ